MTLNSDCMPFVHGVREFKTLRELNVLNSLTPLTKGMQSVKQLQQNLQFLTEGAD